ncbi:MAG: 50S ribosomal protein L30 [Peptococcaceae bacterium]|nr:50S ribosomal protein L30 [Peptococcaceae bacterium]
MAELKITLTRSVIGASAAQKKVVKALGLGKTNSTVVRPDNDCIRGMINKVSHLVTVEENN